MFVANESLQKFSQSVPFCIQTEPLEAVRSIFRSGQHEVVVVVNHNQVPQGSIYLHTLLPYILNKQRHSQRGLNTRSIDWQKPLQLLEPPILRSLRLLPAGSPTGELMSFLNDSQGDRSPIALVDSQGKFIGLLDTLGLLEFIAGSQRQGKNLATAKGSGRFKETAAASEPYSSSSLLACPLTNNSQEEKAVEKCYYFTSIVEILEQLPIPLMLQNSEGAVLAQNRAWRSQVGTELELAEIVAKAVKLSQDNEAKKKTAREQPVAIATSAPGTPSMRGPRSDRLPCQDGAPSLCPLFVQSNSFSATSDGYFCFCSQQPGQERVWQFAHQPLFDLSLIMAQDITEKHLVAKELEAKNADLIQLNRLKDEFLACITHELKTPLTAVLGLSNLLKGQALGKLNDRQARYANLIHESGRHLMTVVNDILDLTRMETGQMELTPQPVKIPSVCDRAYQETLELRTKGNGGDRHPPESPPHPLESKFTLEIEPGLEMLVADELRLRQMLVNLLSNALKFTPIGGKIGLKVTRWERWIAFTVWDTGIGIPAEKQHLIFQKFQQLESPLTRQFEGTGLGLVLTQRLARLHGGDVTFISTEKKGSEFTLILPPSPPPKSLVNNRETEENFGQQQLKKQKTITKPEKPEKLPITHNQISLPNYSSRLVLIVEAVPHYIEDLSEKLTALGYQVVIARSGTEALEKVRRLQPRAIFLNPILPVLSGWDVLTLLKTDADTREIPVIITATRGDKERGLLHKANGFLSLPVQQLSLEKTVAESLKPLSCIPHQKLTILRIIYRRNQKVTALDNEHKSIYDLSLLLHPYDCRIVEADEIEEAELLARIWHPDVVLLENLGGKLLTEELLEELNKSQGLTSLPLVTLDARTTQAANKIKELSVFPCLDYENATHSKEKIENDSEFIASALWQVISIAARTNLPPNILVVDVSNIADFTAYSSKSLSEEAARISQNRQENSTAENSDRSSNLGSTKALIQYLKIGGFRSLLTRYWSEVLQHLQYQSVDLLLICLRGNLPSELLEALFGLKKLKSNTPILVWEDSDFTLPANFTSDELNSILKEVASQTLPYSISMSDLLEKIKNSIHQSKAKDLVG